MTKRSNRKKAYEGFSVQPCLRFQTHHSHRILILAEEGKLSLDDPVSRYIPEVSAWGDGARDITIEQVLHHTSG
ncbi:MAG TPA: hypothetical protein DEA96_18880, partial [Leptospiraceae bacterium]|nr:hypothetical protein [Leptospiraceae bacterium]